MTEHAAGYLLVEDPLTGPNVSHLEGGWDSVLAIGDPVGLRVAGGIHALGLHGGSDWVAQR